MYYIYKIHICLNNSFHSLCLCADKYISYLFVCVVRSLNNVVVVVVVVEAFVLTPASALSRLTLLLLLFLLLLLLLLQLQLYTHKSYTIIS